MFKLVDKMLKTFLQQRFVNNARSLSLSLSLSLAFSLSLSLSSILYNYINLTKLFSVSNKIFRYFSKIFLSVYTHKNTQFFC